MDERFVKLKEQLDLQEWPAVYMFKFIVPNTPEKIAVVSALFDDATDLNFQPSKAGKYVSISAKEMMLSSEEVINKYLESAKIEGLISL